MTCVFMVTALARPVSCPIVYQNFVHRVQISTDKSGLVSRRYTFGVSGWRLELLAFTAYDLCLGFRVRRLANLAKFID